MMNDLLDRIHDYPMLKRDEEFDLALRWRENGDANAMHRLATSHMRLVAKIASGYANHGHLLDDLMSEGFVGLTKAINRFKPEKGFRLSTYATFWIRASILEFIIHSKSLVKIGTTVAQKKLFFNLAKARDQIKSINGDRDDMTPEAIAGISKRLNVSESEVISMHERLGGDDISLNAYVYDSENTEMQDLLEDVSANQEVTLGDKEEFSRRRHLFLQAMKELNQRERHILECRRLYDKKKLLREIGDRYGISPERVRQIEINAFKKIQKSIRISVLANTNSVEYPDCPRFPAHLG